MSIEDFSNGFDTLLNSYATKMQFGEQGSRIDVELDEYEKSFFLTKSQEEIVVSLYNGKNVFNDSFEKTEETRRYLSNLVIEEVLDPETNTSGYVLGMDGGLKSKFFTLPEDVWYITYEAVNVSYGPGSNCGVDGVGTIEVVPVKQDEYNKLKKNPFRGANRRRALRLDLADGVIEVISTFPIANYYLRYLRKPCPIVLTDLAPDTSIDNMSKTSPCELHEALHQKILERAVELAIRSKGYNRNTNNENR